MKESFLIQEELIKATRNHGVWYPTPINIGYSWGYGSLAGICLVIQIITGIFLVMHYVPHTNMAFDSVEHIMRDVNYGWLIRYTHSNGASMFFIVVYMHIGRGIYYGSYLFPRRILWFSGILLFLLMMGTGFIGYVLPWGQMSFWGATVITNLVTVIPYVGHKIVFWIWGGFSVDNATLNRFLSIHYVLPFIITVLVVLHLLLLHNEGSSNPLSVDTVPKIPFYPYFFVKDLFYFLLFVLFFSYFVFFIPNFLGHPDNYIKANALVTPPHIVPEWYFLPFYAILRSIPNKFLGVIAMLGAILILALLPIYETFFKSGIYKPRYKLYYWCFVFNFILLGWLGSQPVEYPFVELGQMASKIHFLYFLFFIPYAGIWDVSSNFKNFPFNLLYWYCYKIKMIYLKFKQ